MTNVNSCLIQYPRLTGIILLTAAVFEIKFLWVNMTPLGFPVGWKKLLLQYVYWVSKSNKSLSICLVSYLWSRWYNRLWQHHLVLVAVV